MSEGERDSVADLMAVARRANGELFAIGMAMLASADWDALARAVRELKPQDKGNE